MRTGVYLYSMLRIVLALALLLSGSAFGNEDSPMYYLTLSSIGFPTAEKQKDARKINELKIFEGRLYLGHGDATVNTGPTDIIYYDLATDEFITEFTIDDGDGTPEAITILKTETDIISTVAELEALIQTKYLQLNLILTYKNISFKFDSYLE